MSDYQIDCATKEEWAQRAFNAEARIEELKAKLTKEVEKNFPPMYLHPTVAEECIDDLHDKVSELKRDKQELEAKLAKAVEALNEIAEEERIGHLNGGLYLTGGAIIARTTLAELKRRIANE